MNILNVKLDITLLTETFITLFTFIIIPMSVMNSSICLLRACLLVKNSMHLSYLNFLNPSCTVWTWCLILLAVTVLPQWLHSLCVLHRYIRYVFVKLRVCLCITNFTSEIFESIMNYTNMVIQVFSYKNILECLPSWWNMSNTSWTN